MAAGRRGVMPQGSNLIWTIVGVLAIIALIIWLAPHIN